MHKKLYYGSILIVCLLILNSCIAVDPVKEKCQDWEADEYFAQTIENLSIKAQEFALNPNKTTCLAYKNAYLDYVEELRDWRVCYDYHGLGNEYEAQIDLIEDTINNLDCDA